MDLAASSRRRLAAALAAAAATAKMTHRQRVLAALQFQPTDRVPYDIMEGAVWPELMDYFRREHGLEDAAAVYDFLDTDFRWAGMQCRRPDDPARQTPPAVDRQYIFAKDVTAGPLAEARTAADVEAHNWPDPAWWSPGDYAAARRRWPDHALVFSAGWMPLFWGACEAFGMENALILLHTRPAVFEAFVQRQHEFYTAILRRGLAAAGGHCDICWLGDDFAGQQAMMIRPELWRRYIAPRLAEQVAMARGHGMCVLYHSCGAVRPVLGDLIDMGVSALLVFQTIAAGMDAESIAAEFGGRLAFYGGIDVQQLLSFGTPEQVRRRVRENARAFAACGGYIAANSHHGVATIRGENVLAMCRASRDCNAQVVHSAAGQ